MSWVQLGLAAVIAIPVAVTVAMIFWPSSCDKRPPGDDGPQTRRPRRYEEPHAEPPNMPGRQGRGER